MNKIGISRNLGEIKVRIEEAARRAGRDAAGVKLVAVSKKHPPTTIRSGVASGIHDFGESYAQELVEKAETLSSRSDEIRWHFIGHLQRNKVAHLLPYVTMIHAVDSERLARQIDKEAQKIGRIIPVLLQVNTSGESSKYGCFPGGALTLAERILEMENIEVHGLMTLAARVDDPDDARPMFQLLRDTRDLISEKIGCDLPELSMGMSEDFEVAVEEGSTMVRLGTRLFGPRPV